MRRDDVDTTWIDILTALLIFGIIAFLLLSSGEAGETTGTACPLVRQNVPGEWVQDGQTIGPCPRARKPCRCHWRRSAALSRAVNRHHHPVETRLRAMRSIADTP